MKMPFSSLSRETRIGLVVLLVLLLFFAAIKLWLFPLLTGGTHSAAAGDRPDDTTLREVRDFEQRRRADSLRYIQARQAQWDEWQREKAERQRAREQQEAEYQANRARWDAEKAERAARRAEREARYDSLRRLRPQKLAQGAHLDANSADTADFQRIPGVGTAYARAIVGYRERLGGFIDARQLTEINGLPYDAAHCSALSAPTPQPQSRDVQSTGAAPLSQLRTSEIHREPAQQNRSAAWVGRSARLPPVHGARPRSACALCVFLITLSTNRLRLPQYIDHNKTPSRPTDFIENKHTATQKNDIYNYTTSTTQQPPDKNWTGRQRHLPSHRDDVRGDVHIKERFSSTPTFKTQKNRRNKSSCRFQFSQVPNFRACRHALATYVALSLGLYRVSLYAVRSCAVSLSAVLVGTVSHRHAVAVVSSGSLSLVTARSERDSCESYEHENQFLHCCVSLE